MSVERQRRFRRILFLLFILLAALIGIGSRDQVLAGSFIGKFAGDTMWTFALYFLIRFINPRITPLRCFILTCSVSVMVEVSQLFNPAWLEYIRRTRLGGLALGFGFKWSDFLCYLAGSLLAMLTDHLTSLKSNE